MPKVVCKRAVYEYETLKPLIYDILDSVGGDLIHGGGRILIKPNLLAPAAPDRAMLTHPMFVRAAVEYVLDKGGKPQVSDSPAMGTFERIMKESGIRQALEGLPVDCKEFKASVTVNVGEPFGRIEIAEDVLNADAVINLPKLKTHAQMLLTLGVKNLFGCVVGLRKPQWHMRTGVDREMFATLLVRICQAVKPSVTILDGVLAMEGQGPGKGGVPKQIGVIMGSDDPVALDMVVCRMLGLPPESVPTNVAAEAAGLLKDPVEIEGEVPIVRDFKLPVIGDLVFGPPWTHALARKHLVQRPVPDESLCRSCGDCLRYCPAKAISSGRKKIDFDYDKCIRCYCCIEVCPHGALRAEEPLLGRLFTKLIKRKS